MALLRRTKKRKHEEHYDSLGSTATYQSNPLSSGIYHAPVYPYVPETQLFFNVTKRKMPIPFLEAWWCLQTRIAGRLGEPPGLVPDDEVARNRGEDYYQRQIEAHFVTRQTKNWLRRHHCTLAICYGAGYHGVVLGFEAETVSIALKIIISTQEDVASVHEEAASMNRGAGLGVSPASLFVNEKKSRTPEIWIVNMGMEKIDVTLTRVLADPSYDVAVASRLLIDCLRTL
ncbi:MAG: hypothetical protein EBZ48_10540, partial [Proteobacteria bacterium]|nr:hypothetical protein [Pseudomonadota bacterium]